MKIEAVIWLRNVVDKLYYKHHVETEEVEEALSSKPKYRLVQKGKRKGENVYMALGRSFDGRYLSVFFIYKKSKEALILSARNMAHKERREYERR